MRICVNPSQDELLPVPGWKLPIIAHMSIGCLLASLRGRSFRVSVFIADGLDVRSSSGQIGLGERDMVLPSTGITCTSVIMAGPLISHFTNSKVAKDRRWPASNGACLLAYFTHLLQWVPSGGH